VSAAPPPPPLTAYMVRVLCTHAHASPARAVGLNSECIGGLAATVRGHLSIWYGVSVAVWRRRRPLGYSMSGCACARQHGTRLFLELFLPGWEAWVMDLRLWSIGAALVCLGACSLIRPPGCTGHGAVCVQLVPS
jgi:hypothetical protein